MIYYCIYTKLGGSQEMDSQKDWQKLKQLRLRYESNISHNATNSIFSLEILQAV